MMVSMLDMLSTQSITSQCQIANSFWQDTSEKHYSHNNRGEWSLCGVVLTKLTRPFTAFDTGLAASHNGRHINLQMLSGKLKCQRFSQQHQGLYSNGIKYPLIQGTEGNKSRRMLHFQLPASCTDGQMNLLLSILYLFQ